MNKLTIVVNDYSSNYKSFISYDLQNIAMVMDRYRAVDDHLVKLQILPEFEGYTRWDELTPNHYRFLIGRALTVIDSLAPEDRSDSRNPDVTTTNFIIAAFVIRLEELTCSEIEHFRINRFDEHAVTYDYSGTFEIQYDRPRGKPIDHSSNPFSIVVDNT